MGEPSYIVPEWLKILICDCEEEANFTSEWPIKLLQPNLRKVLWAMCNVLKVNKHGVPGQACRMLELHIATYIRDNALLAHVDWPRFKHQLNSRMPLLTAACIQLAAKMCSARYSVSAKGVRKCLLQHGSEHSVNEIIATELTVFKTLGFRVSMWTGVEAGEMLALEVGIPKHLLKIVATIINFTEYRRNKFNLQEYQNVPESTAICDLATIRSLHLVVGAVAASARYLDMQEPDPAPRLALITGTPHAIVEGVAKVILERILTELYIKDKL